MKKSFLSYALTIVAILAISFSSCKKTDEVITEEETTVEQDKANIKNSFTQLKSLAQNFRNGSFYHFAEDFVGIGEHDEEDVWYQYVGDGRGDYSWYSGYEYTPGTGNYIRIIDEWGTSYKWVGEGNGDYTFVSEMRYTPGYGDYIKKTDNYTYFGVEVPEFTETLVTELEKVLPYNQIIEERRLNMPQLSGKYTWNQNTKKWTKAAANNTIQILFPSKASISNDCDLEIKNYSDQACDIVGKTVYLPTKLNSSFTKNGEKLAEINVNASFTNYGIPQNASVSVYAKPLKISSSLTQSSSSRYEATVTITDETNSKNSLSINGEATLGNAINSYSDFSDCELHYLKFTITQYNLTINGTLDLKTLNKINHPSATDINSCININVLYKNVKIGTLGIEELGMDKQKFLFIYYKDGTKDNTEIYYSDFLDEIANIFIKK